jgi:2-oxoglutarate ferredoxin oxidoreductase subunit delta
MARVVIRKERCKACGFCIIFCPKQVLAMSDDMNIRGVHYASVTDEEKCDGCAVCGLVCPDVALEVYR